MLLVAHHDGEVQADVADVEVEALAAERGNIVQIEHRREGFHLDVGDVGLDLTGVMRNEEHCQRLIDAMEETGFPVDRIR